MPLIGTRPVARPAARGTFHCPRCGADRPFVTYRVRRYAALLGVPLLRMATLGSYVECRQCRGTFPADVLDYDRARAQEQFLPEFHRIVRRLMVMTMVSDGAVRPEEIRVAGELYRRLTGAELTERDVRQELRSAERDGRTVLEYLADTGGLLNENGRDLVLKAAFLVSSADGRFHEKEADFLRAVGRALRMSPRQLREAIDALVREGSGAG